MNVEKRWYLAVAVHMGRTYTTMIASAHRALARTRLKYAAPTIPASAWVLTEA